MIRIPNEIAKKAELDAAANDRTLNKQLLHLIKNFYQDQTPTRRQVATKP